MSVPFFFSEKISTGKDDIILDDESSKHIVQVLRMQKGEKILLTDGNGNMVTGEIADAHKKHCSVRRMSSSFVERRAPYLTIAISLIKNAGRFEWFLEKATELGTAEIIPLICDRTEKQHARHDRLVNICKSAMMQSSQVWMPVVHQPTAFKDVVNRASQEQKMIAHCTEDNKHKLSSVINGTFNSHMILIGPEGDFSDEEVEIAKALNFKGVSLGDTRLRTETAGIYAAVLHAAAKS